VPAARYDGQTEWYEALAGGEAHVAARGFAVSLLGGGPGECLDLGCGTGLAVPLLVEAGWSVVGVDVSQDQLELAAQRFGTVARFVRTDAHTLPFEDERFDAVISLLTHTDLDDPARAFGEARRVLRPGGSFVYLGVHPCFGSPFVARARAVDIEGAVAVVLPGYAEAGWRPVPAEPHRITARVGINHLPLAGLLNAIIGSGFRISRVDEPGDADPPLFFSVTARALPAL
jgi:SAM-dependent methyltransferase